MRAKVMLDDVRNNIVLTQMRRSIKQSQQVMNAYFYIDIKWFLDFLF